ncbi:MAG: excinuclease ABC subunit UvrC [Desulfatirhabdiaceae bacterium]
MNPSGTMTLPDSAGNSPASRFADLLAGLSTRPGVYLMKDDTGKVIYVGKAINLKKRLTSYFNKIPQLNIKTRMLVDKIQDIETILTSTENEALILESNLIKKYRPRYNVILKDDKHYPSLRLDLKSPYPCLSVVRKVVRDGSLYFGPFTSPPAVYQTLKIINKTFKLRKCRDQVFKTRNRPCLNYQIGACLGPCCLPVDPESYQNMVKEVVLFLKGRAPELIKKTEADMLAAAREQNFELAAQLRDKMFALQRTIEKQAMVTTDFMDRDIVGIADTDGKLLVTVMSVRSGHVVGTRHYPLPETVATLPELIGSFLTQYYETAHYIPEEILAPAVPEDVKAIRLHLRDRKGSGIVIRKPHQGIRVQLLQLANQNAENELKSLMNSRDHDEKLLQRLMDRLGLRRFPGRIECFDNSHIQGDSPVSGMVVFENARPARAGYRRYKIRMTSEPDDYAFMAEALKRRFGKGEASRPFPDLLLVDGGKGQLNIALSVLRDLNLTDELDVAALAKKDEIRGETEDRVFRPGRANPVNLDMDHDVLLFLQRIRDEAHRNVIQFHRKQKRGSSFQSILDNIPGIGEKRKHLLLIHFRTIRAIRAASLADITGLPGMNRKSAEAVREALDGEHKRMKAEG